MKSNSYLQNFLREVARILVVLSIAAGLFGWLMPAIGGHQAAVLAATASPFVQAKDNQVTSGPTNTITLPAPTTAGNLLAVYVMWDRASSVSISDSNGNVYASALAPILWNSGKYSAQIFYAKNIKGGVDTITARFSTNISSFGIVYVNEYAGLDPVAPVDVTAAAIGSTSSVNSGSVVTSSAQDLLFAGVASMDIVTRPGTGYTARSTAEGNMTEDRVVSTAGTYNATATNSRGGWAIQMVALRFASGSGVADTVPPSVPAGLSAVAASTSQINLSWAPSTDSVSTQAQIKYLVYRNGSLIGTTASGITSWQDTGLAPSTTYSYFVKAQDVAGNTSAQSLTVSATTNAAAPSISSFNATPTSVAPGQNSTLSWSVSNATSISINNGIGVVSASGSTTVSPAATTTYTLTASNSGGTSTAQTSVTVSSDTTAPSVPTISATAVSGSQINLSWTAATDNIGVAGYRLYRGSTLLIDTTARTYSDTGLTQGTTYSYTVLAYDAAGNKSAQSVAATATTTTTDTQNPTVNITSPSSNQTVSGTVTVSASASDNVGVTGVQFMLDGSSVGQEILSSPYSMSWDTSAVQSGTHVLTAMAYDAAGNTATSPAVSVTVNNNTGGNTYTTNFPLTENPISENGKWINGKTTGLDWANVTTTPGKAIGTESGSNGYDDSTAILAGTWGPDQTAQATVFAAQGFHGEVELRLRSSISAHQNSGYEINFSGGYCQVVRWEGALGDFTMLANNTGASVQNGDVVKASIVGSEISVYINGNKVNDVIDSTYKSGAPGIGFFNAGSSNSPNSDYGFTNFTASDNGSGGTTQTAGDTTPPSSPTNLSGSAFSSSQINLSWTASTDNVGVAGYQVFRNNAQITTTGTTSFSDTGLNPNTQYAYTVAAYDAAGNVSSQSTQLLVTTLAPDTTPPSVPTNLQSSKVASTSLTVSWTASTDDVAVASYRILRNGSQVGTSTNTSYNDSGLTPGTTYAYTVVAVDSSNNASAESQQLLVTTTTNPTSIPTFVQTKQNQISSGTSVSTSFNSATGAGNTIVAYVIWNNTASVTLKDSRGDSFVSVSAPVRWAGQYNAQVFYATNIAGGTDTITATFGTSVSSFGVLYVHEYSGINPTNPVDVTVSASGSSSTLNSGTATTTSVNDLIFGAGVSDNTVTVVGSGFTLRNSSYGNITEDRAGSAVGTYSATATHNGSAWGMQLVAFRAAN